MMSWTVARAAVVWVYTALIPAMSGPGYQLLCIQYGLDKHLPAQVNGIGRYIAANELSCGLNSFVASAKWMCTYSTECNVTYSRISIDPYCCSSIAKSVGAASRHTILKMASIICVSSRKVWFGCVDTVWGCMSNFAHSIRPKMIVLQQGVVRLSRLFLLHMLSTWWTQDLYSIYILCIIYVYTRYTRYIEVKICIERLRYI